LLEELDKKWQLKINKINLEENSLCFYINKIVNCNIENYINIVDTTNNSNFIKLRYIEWVLYYWKKLEKVVWLQKRLLDLLWHKWQINELYLLEDLYWDSLESKTKLKDIQIAIHKKVKKLWYKSNILLINDWKMLLKL